MFQRLRGRLLGQPPSVADEKIAKRIAGIEKDLHTLAAQQQEVVGQLRKLLASTEGVGRIETDLKALADQQDEVFRQLRRLHAGVDGLVRAEYLDPTTLPYAQRIAARGF